MRQDLCDITIVLDRSGSMNTVLADTIGGFNTFIKKQREVPGECVVSLVQFDDEYDVVYTAKPVAAAPLLDGATFVPRGMTALLDAIGTTVNATGTRLAGMPENDRPGKVLFVILTDGGENASHEYTKQKVFDMIEHQKKQYRWDFVFLGANQDAISVAGGLGISANSSMTYAANAQGTAAAFASASNYVVSTRTVGSASFTDEDRDAQAKAGVK